MGASSVRGLWVVFEVCIKGLCCVMVAEGNVDESRCLFAFCDSENSRLSSSGTGHSSGASTFSSHSSSSFTVLISLVSPSNNSPVDVGVQRSVAIGAGFEADEEFGLSLKVDEAFGMSMGVELGFSLTEDVGLERVIGVKLEPIVNVGVELGPNLMPDAELGISVAKGGGLGTIVANEEGLGKSLILDLSLGGLPLRRGKEIAGVFLGVLPITGAVGEGLKAVLGGRPLRRGKDDEGEDDAFLFSFERMRGSHSSEESIL